MTNEQMVAVKLLQVKAVQLNVLNPYTWASGWKSPIYCDNRKVLSFPFIRDYIKSEMCNIIFETFSEAEMIAGVATAGIAWGAMAADQLKLPYVYVRASQKEHGLGNQIEGYFETGVKTVVVEDLISTGKSSLLAADALRKADVNVLGVISIFDYGFDVAKEAFDAAGLPYESLTTYTSLIEMAAEKNIIEPSMQDVLMQWRKSPSTWQQ